ncbi:M48 family metalloprotease, partial [Candidatus Woesearchaeota archaeon]|nr:M48 family metalloprotease [Candidatus Woesearchaeota archaeon]
MIPNQLKTVILLGALTGLLLLVGGLLGGQNGLLIALIFSLLMNLGSYWFSDKVVLAMYRAREVKDKHSKLYKTVKEVSEIAGIPMPKVYIIPSEQSNAFATGRSPKHAAVAATEGILKLLTDNELKGVIAHEVSHVKNRDVLVSTIAATIAGVISYLAFMARFAAIFGDRDRNGNSLFQLLAISIITPIIAMLIQFAISRSREYLADNSGAGMLKNSHGLASALEKLEKDAKV